MRLSSPSYTRRFGGLQENAEEWELRTVECDCCRDKLAASSLPHHLHTHYGVYAMEEVEMEELEECNGLTFFTHWLEDRKLQYPIPGCIG